jgi:magnesium chelatase family protein
VPAANAREAQHVEANTVRAAARLDEVLAWLDGCAELPRVAALEPLAAPESALDFADIHGQEMPKRAVVIAAAGGHNLLLFGPPGSGKSMLAERLPTLLPPLSNMQYLTTAAIASLCGRAPPQTSAAPFRAPHHTATARALLGGGGRPRPGEVSLAHHGVLFLDELPEFRRDALEALREPLESGTVCISRAMHQTAFPAEFQLVAAMNPCPCGFSGDPERCSCTPAQLARYTSRVSGPLLDRIDMHVEVPRVAVPPNGSRFAPETPGLRQSVAAARRRQLDRAGTVNARLSAEQLRATARLGGDAQDLLERCAREWQLSGRAVARALKTARTIADIAGTDAIAARHVAESLQLRQLDRRFRGAGFAL